MKYRLKHTLHKCTNYSKGQMTELYIICFWFECGFKRTFLFTLSGIRRKHSMYQVGHYKHETSKTALTNTLKQLSIYP